MAASVDFDAIVIGASAGGVDALLALLPALSQHSPAAVVVLHLRRDRPSLLASIFGQACSLPVEMATDGMRLLPGTITFAPPDYHLLVDRGPRLRLSIEPPVNFSRPAIDVLFESAADVLGARVLAIVLSGNNDDGAAGAAAIALAGGRVLVQDPAEARGPEMPEAALARVPAAMLSPLAGIADCLRTLEAKAVAP